MVEAPKSPKLSGHTPFGSSYGEVFQPEFEVNPFQCRDLDVPLLFGKLSLFRQLTYTWEIKSVVMNLMGSLAYSYLLMEAIITY